MIKKIFALVAALSIAFGAAAEFRWGPTAGLNVSSFFWKQKLCKTTQLAGFQAGIMGEVMIPGIGFGIDMALKYHLNGATVNFGEHEVWASDGIGNQKVWMHTLEIPLNLRFKWTRMQGLTRHYWTAVWPGRRDIREIPGVGRIRMGCLIPDTHEEARQLQCPGAGMAAQRGLPFLNPPIS